MSSFRRDALVIGLALLAVGCARSQEPRTSPRASGDSTGAVAPTSASTVDSSSVAAAVDVLRGYYAAIAARDFHRAYERWEGDGAASGKSFAAFAAGFANTASVTASPGTPGPTGAAAGSRYIEIPIRISARTTDGASQHYIGTYVLRRSEVDGATAAQRRWHIYSAKIRKE